MGRGWMFLNIVRISTLRVLKVTFLDIVVTIGCTVVFQTSRKHKHALLNQPLPLRAKKKYNH